MRTEFFRELPLVLTEGCQAAGEILRLVTASLVPVVFQGTFEVAPQAEYVFQARVRCNDRAWIAVGDRQLGYQDIGQWQILSDVVRTPETGRLPLSFHLGGLQPEGGGQLEIADVRLTLAVPPILPPREPYAGTPLTHADQALAAIVYPAQRPQYAVLAQAIAKRIRERTGCSLPLLTDVEVTETDSPALRQEYKGRPLILLGRLGINRAIWTAYNRFLCALDGHYPGGDGYVVRTAARVLPGHVDHLLVGGSTETGAARAVERFLERLAETPLAADGSLVLPWLLDVELGGRCRTLFDEDEQRWDDNPFQAGFPPLEPGYGTIVRWYYNAMGYYWSGRESYRHRASALLDRIVEDQAYTHHYVSEWLVRVHDMLDDSPTFSPDQVAALDRLILKNFWEHLTGSDGCRMEIFAPPFEAIPAANRHNIAPWMADLTMAEFLQSHFALSGDLATLTEYRRREKEAMFEHCIATRWDGTLPSLSGCDNEEEIIASFYRYALEHDRYSFFSTGNAKRALLLERLNHRFGRLSRPAGAYDYKPFLGVLASLCHDGLYAALWHSLPDSMPAEHVFQKRSILEVHRYAPGEEVPEASTDALAGVRAAPLQPHNWLRLRSGAVPDSVMPNCASNQIAEVVAFRSGFTPTDDYVALSGTGGHCPPGAFLDFTAAGEYWFGTGSSAIRRPPAKRYFDQNAVHVLRTDDGLATLPAYPAAAQLDWLADFRDGGGCALVMDPIGDASWRRTVVWVRPGLYVVADSVTARQTGEFDLSINWFPQGIAIWNERCLTVKNGGAVLRLTPFSSAFTITENSATAEEGTPTTLRQRATVHLQAGESRSAWTVIEVQRDPAIFSVAQYAGEGIIKLGGDVDEDETLLLLGSQQKPGLEFDGGAAVIRGDHVRVMQARRLVLGGRVLLEEHEETTKEFSIDAVDLRQVIDSLPVSAETLAADASVDSQRTPLPSSEPTSHWSYTGLLKPALVRSVRRIDPMTVDFGREVSLEEIRAFVASGPWVPASIPDDLVGAPATSDGCPPAEKSSLWKPLGQDAVWVPGVATGNYGRADPVAQARQIAYPGGVRVRYLRSRAVETLCCFDGAIRAARTPLKLVAADLDDDGQTEILVLPDPWPAFLRRRETEDGLLVALKPDGRELFRFQLTNNVQSAQVLDLDGQPRLVVVSDDAQIHILNGDGFIHNHVDLYAMHQEFNRLHGRPNTRHPAGGLTMPYSIGAWRPDAQGHRKLLVSRYCAYSFLDQKGQFEGVLHNVGIHNVGYVIVRVLPHGIDFNGDGREEQLALGLEALHHLDGEATPVIPEPDGDRFYPQIYGEKTLSVPATGGTVDGAQPLLFEPVALGSDATPRFVLVARANYLALYDARRCCWAFEWKPAVDLASATVVDDTAGRLILLTATRDGRLWRLELCASPEVTLVSVVSRYLPETIRRLRQAGSGSVFACGADGLYLLDADLTPRRIAGGGWQDALQLPGPERPIIAATDCGEIVRLDLD